MTLKDFNTKEAIANEINHIIVSLNWDINYNKERIEKEETEENPDIDYITNRKKDIEAKTTVIKLLQNMEF